MKVEQWMKEAAHAIYLYDNENEDDYDSDVARIIAKHAPVNSVSGVEEKASPTPTEALTPEQFWPKFENKFPANYTPGQFRDIMDFARKYAALYDESPSPSLVEGQAAPTTAEEFYHADRGSFHPLTRAKIVFEFAEAYAEHCTTSLQAELKQVAAERSIAMDRFNKTNELWQANAEKLVRAEAAESKLSGVEGLIETVKTLLEWLPICSEGSSGYLRRVAVERVLKSLGIIYMSR
jgi:hypothetical protein